MSTYLVTRHRSGPEWLPGQPLEAQSGWRAHADFMDALVDEGVILLGGPLADEFRVVLVFEAESPAAINATLARDPWTATHLVTVAIEPWTIRLDGLRLS